MDPETSWKHDVNFADGLTRIVLSGEFDLRAAEQLRTVLKTSMGANSRVVADLAAVGFIDSSVISVLIEARNEATSSGRSFAVTNPSPQVRRVLDVMGVLGFLTGSA